MRKVLLLFGIVAGCAEPTSSTAPPIVLLVAGQSNGTSHNLDGTPVYSTTGHVWVNDYFCEYSTPTPVNWCHQGTVMLQPTARRTVRSNQAWIILGDSLYRLTGRDVYVHNVSIGGRGTDSLSTKYFGGFKIAVANNPDICAVLWVQGESEAAFSPATTVANMQLMIDATREIHSDLPWIVALNDWGRTAQLQLIADGVVRRGPDIDSMRVAAPAFFEAEGADEFLPVGHRAHAGAWVRPVIETCHAAL